MHTCVCVYIMTLFKFVSVCLYYTDSACNSVLVCGCTCAHLVDHGSIPNNDNQLYICKTIKIIAL